MARTARSKRPPAAKPAPAITVRTERGSDIKLLMRVSGPGCRLSLFVDETQGKPTPMGWVETGLDDVAGTFHLSQYAARETLTNLLGSLDFSLAAQTERRAEAARKAERRAAIHAESRARMLGQVAA